MFSLRVVKQNRASSRLAYSPVNHRVPGPVGASNSERSTAASEMSYDRRDCSENRMHFAMLWTMAARCCKPNHPGSMSCEGGHTTITKDPFACKGSSCTPSHQDAIPGWTMANNQHSTTPIPAHMIGWMYNDTLLDKITPRRCLSRDGPVVGGGGYC